MRFKIDIFLAVGLNQQYRFIFPQKQKKKNQKKDLDHWFNPTARKGQYLTLKFLFGLVLSSYPDCRTIYIYIFEL